MYCSEMTTRFCGGRSIPEIRAISLVSPNSFSSWRSALPLLVPRVGGANHPHHTPAVDHLALVADLLHRCSNLHDDSKRLLKTGVAEGRTNWGRRAPGLLRPVGDAPTREVIG